MLISANHLVTGDGKTALSGQALRLAKGRIAACGPREQLLQQYPGEPHTDYGEATILPGLIDMHLHLGYWYDRPDREAYDPHLVAYMALHNAQRYLAAGVTTVRDVFSPDGLCQKLVLAKQKGFVQAPRVIYCNRALTISGGIDWHCQGSTIQVDGVEECRKAVREQIRTGAAWVKVMTSNRQPVAEFTQEELNVIVAECHRRGRKAAAHASLQPALQMAIEAGFDTIEHGTDLTLEQVKQMVAKGIALVPTIYVFRYILRQLRQKEATGIQLTAREQQTCRLYEASGETYARNLAAWAQTGLTMLAGTDLVMEDNDAQGLAGELECMVDYGLSPLAAIATATGNAARVLDLSEPIGSTEPGSVADLLVVSGDAATDIRALRQVVTVYQDGQALREIS